jgi:hypothetical protein
VYLAHLNQTATVQNVASHSARNPGSYCPPLQFEVVQLPSIQIYPNQPKLKKIQIPELLYAIFLRVLYNFCYDRRWDRWSHRILVFPNASESELQHRAKQLVMGYLI